MKVYGLLIFLLSCMLPHWLLIGRINLDDSLRLDEQGSVGHLMDKMNLRLYKEGELEWQLRAEQAESFKEGTWNLFELDGDFTQPEKAQIVFKGDRGAADLINKFVSIEGDVIAESTDGYTFETPTLNIRSGSGRSPLFYSNDKVKIYNKNDDTKIFAKGIKGDVGTGQVELLSEVRCKKSVKQYKDILIKSDMAKFTSSLKGVRFSENLTISQENFNIEGKEAYFLYNEKTQNLKSVQIDGDILASDGTKTALSDRVEMRTDEDVIIFQGNPRIRVGKNEMVGEEILITNKQKNIQVIRGNIKSTKKGVDLDE